MAGLQWTGDVPLWRGRASSSGDGCNWAGQLSAKVAAVQMPIPVSRRTQHAILRRSDKLAKIDVWRQREGARASICLLLLLLSSCSLHWTGRRGHGQPELAGSDGAVADGLDGQRELE